MRAIIRWLEAVGSLPSDSPDERLRKATLSLCAGLVVPISVAWVSTYWALGLIGPATIPLAYQVVSVAAFVHLFKTKRFAVFRAVQLSLMLLLPFVLQWSLGGFMASSTVSIWAFISPLGAIIFVGPRRAVPWFVAFIALMALSAVIDPVTAGHAAEIPTTLRVAFFAMNVCGVALVTYGLLQYFVRQRDRARAELDREHMLLQLEQAKSERLLLNVLPRAIADRLKEREEIIADGFDSATVLFADIADFTPFAEREDPAWVVRVLDELFSAFDRLADRLRLEKIKTIGDAYMVAGGLPEPMPNLGFVVLWATVIVSRRGAPCRSRARARCPPTSWRVAHSARSVVAGAGEREIRDGQGRHPGSGEEELTGQDGLAADPPNVGQGLQDGLGESQVLHRMLQASPLDEPRPVSSHPGDCRLDGVNHIRVVEPSDQKAALRRSDHVLDGGVSGAQEQVKGERSVGVRRRQRVSR
jgi:class 3 adenylate cyclase